MATSLPTAIAYPLDRDIPASHVDWPLDPQRCALLVHDMQRHFIAPYSANEEPMGAVIPAIALLLDEARSRDVPVFYTAQPSDQPAEKRALVSDFWGPGMTGKPEAARIIDELTPAAGDTVLTKWRYSAFAKTNLRERLRALSRDQLLITGVYADIGIKTTAVVAFMEDIQPFLVHDAVADFTAADHQAASRWVAQRAGRVISTDDALRSLRSA
ncbi:isochorismatase family protein [Corynebacterium auris]|uniref:isochorismatase family protein n=1 Tax=Corynebacterium auris TaxID=44750 RepID=UPI0025B5525F|nr:isochorismatase family protein [Corynebacterium auris]WJY68451.1 Isochorismatase [Corynebacterium auris]